MEIRGFRRWLPLLLVPALLGATAALALTAAGDSGRSPAAVSAGDAGPIGPIGPTGPTGPREVDLADRVDAYTARFSSTTPYTVPDSEQCRAVADGVAHAVEGRPDLAGQSLGTVGFRLTEFVDRATGRRLAEIADASALSEAERGWGRVYLDLSAQASWSVQVPHPVSDASTELLGVETFRAAPGGVLVLAGAHRRAGADGSSDPAHQADTVFAAVLDALAVHALPGIQVHGFDEDSLSGQDAVVSAGTAAPGPAAKHTADALERTGFTVCRAWREKCGNLEGTTNIAGRTAADLGLPWLHIELANNLRTDDSRRAEAAAALAATARLWAESRAGAGEATGSSGPVG